VNAQYTINELRTVLTPVFSEYGVRSATLFGSYAKGSAGAKSGVDILVDSGLRGLRLFRPLGKCQLRIKDSGGFDRCHTDRAGFRDRTGNQEYGGAALWTVKILLF
jgi:hypothetical protein